MVAALERHPHVRLSLHYSGPLLDWLRAERPAFIERLAGARRPRPGRDPGRRLLRARPRLTPRARPGRPGVAGWPTSSRRCSGGGRPARGWPSASGSRTCRPRWSPPATTGRSSTTRTSGRPPSARSDLWGAVHDRRPGPAPAGLRHRAGPPLPDPVPRRGRGHRLPARARQRGRRADRHDGRRRREVRGVADDLGALLGRASLGGPLLRGARGERRLADDDHARPPGSPHTRRSDGSTSRPGRTSRWASGPCRPTRAWHFAAVAPRRPRPRAGPRRAGCAAPPGATSRSGTARSTTSTSRCSGPPTRWPRCPTDPRARVATDHLYQGQSNDCYWHGLFGGIYIAHMRLATYEHLIAAEDLADTAAGAAPHRRAPRPRPRRARRRPAGDAGAGRLGRSGRGSRHRRLGHPAGPPRAVRGPAPPARGLPRDAARPRMRPTLEAATDAGLASRRRSTSASR